MKKNNEDIKVGEISFNVNYDDIIDKEDSDISLLNEKYKVVAKDINTLKQGGIELQTKLNQAVIDATGLVAFLTGELVSTVSLISTENPKLELYTTDVIDPYFLEAEDHETRITSNEEGIATLNAIVSENFNTFGVYETPAGTLTEGDNAPVRPNLTVINALDPAYIEVQTSPNLFINNAYATASFTLNLSDVVNDSNDKTVAILIYANGELVKTISQDIVAGASGHQLLSGTFPINQGDEVYFEYDITEGTGSITANTPPRINIEVRGNVLEGARASTTVDDVDSGANEGLVPRFKDIDTNINNLKEQSFLFENPANSIITNDNITLTESLKNFKTMELRIGVQQYRVQPILNTYFINQNDNIIIYSDSADGNFLNIRIISFTEIVVQSNQTGLGIFKIVGNERIND